jgi:GAF domain-containing protein
VAVQAVAPLQPTAASPFAFHLPQLNSQIEGIGVFVWVDGSGLSGGLRFDRLSPQSQRLLEQWLKGSPAETAPARAEARAPETTAASAPTPTTNLAMREPAFAAKLKRVAERARILSLAQGASIALGDEPGVFLCEASVGMALEVGTPLNLERGLAAECVATKGLVLCNDAQKDPRVDAATRQQLNLGSVALLPLFVKNKLVAVLAVFSDQPHAFGEQAVRRLREFARTMEAGVLRELNWRRRR